jgi:hypothetical protein
MRKITFALVYFLIAGCATMFGPKTDKVTVNSEPEGAEVYFRGELLGKTPLETDLPRRSEARTM